MPRRLVARDDQKERLRTNLDIGQPVTIDLGLDEPRDEAIGSALWRAERSTALGDSRIEIGGKFGMATGESLAAFGAVFCGVGALDDFIALARTKTPYAGTMLLRDNGVIQSQVGLSEMRLRSARTFVIEHFRSMHALAAEGVPFTQEMRVTNRTVTCFAIQQAREVMNFVYHAAGATAIFEDQAFERRFRDLNTVTQQGQAAFSNFEGMGQTLLGMTSGRQT